MRKSPTLNLDVLYEDNHCLAVNKPAGLLAQGDVTGDLSLVDLASSYLKTKYQKPGNVYVGLVHRLDRPTSGIILLARTSKAASRLSEQFRLGSIEKIYHAVIDGSCPEDSGEWNDTLWKDEERNVVRVVPPNTPGGQEARLAFRVLGRFPRTTQLELRPITGRSHQIRVQLAARGCPIVGDRKYGAVSTLRMSDDRPRIALHAQQLTFTHPTRGEVLSVSAPVPPDWPVSLSEANQAMSDSSTPEAPPTP